MSKTLENVIGGSRAAVLRSLESGMRSVGEIVEETGMSQPNVSNHLARLREQGLVAPQRQGKHIFYSVASPDLVRALLAVPPVTAVSPQDQERTLSDLIPAFEEAVLRRDHDGARNLVDRALAQGLDWRELYVRVFEPLLVRIGRLWEEGKITVSEEHAASNLIERIMSHVAVLRIPEPRDRRSDVVVACVEGEHHQIGARMVADFLAAQGSSVVFLGANVPCEALVQYVQQYHPRTVALSAATPDREEALRKAVSSLKALRNGAPAPRILLGGALVRRKPELADELCVEAPDADCLRKRK